MFVEWGFQRLDVASEEWIFFDSVPLSTAIAGPPGKKILFVLV